MKLRLSASLLSIALAACGGGGKDPDTGPGTPPVTDPVTDPVVTTPALAKDDAVLLAVYAHEIAEAHPTADEGLCLRTRTAGGSVGDASEALIEAVKASHPGALPGSACAGGGPTAVTVSATSKPGIVFDIGPVTWGPDPDVALVVGGGGHRGGSSGILEVEYRVEPKGGAYVVASQRTLRQN